MNPLIIEHLKAGYGQEVILKDVSFEVAKREIRVILGSSGGGKSTLLNNIIGLETPMSGKIFILGNEVSNNPESFTPEIRANTGVTFQNSALLTSMTVGENVSLPLRLQNPGLSDSLLKEIVFHKLSLVHLSHAYHKYPGELSGGMKKRAAIARAIIGDPALLFCDEPSAGLDPLTSKSLDNLLLELRDKLGLSIVIVTHELDSIKAIGDKLIFLSKGNVIFDGTIHEGAHHGPEEVQRFFSREISEEQNSHPSLSFNIKG